MSRGYSLICSVCKGEYSTKSQWSQHLSEGRHQSLARKACLKEWDEPEMKECCLVVFSSFPLKDSEGCRGIDSIVNYLSANVSTFVTDVVWWEDRPYIAVVQFESSQKLDKVVTSLEMSVEALIDGKKVQMKPAVDLLDLEWFGLFPRVSGARVSNCSSPTVTFPRPSHDVNKRDSVFRGEETPNDEEKERDDAEDETSEGDSLLIEALPSNSVTLLRGLARERHWEMPAFSYSKPSEAPSALTTYLCRVTVNGTTYKPRAKQGVASTKLKAQIKAARFCLKKLMPGSIRESGRPATGNCGGVGGKRSLEKATDHYPDENGTHKRKKTEQCAMPGSKQDYDVTVNAKKPYLHATLNELTQRQHWPPPKYIFHQRGNLSSSPTTFSCDVIVNEVEYTWSDAARSWEFEIPKKKQAAKAIIAAFCLTQLTVASSDSKRVAERQLSALSSHITTSTSIRRIKDGDFAQKNMPLSGSLPYHFWSLCRSMFVLGSEYRNTLKIVKDVQAVFSQQDPTARAMLFRYWHLKLRSTLENEDSNDPILIYLYMARAQPGSPLSPYSFMGAESVTSVLSRARKQFIVLDCSKDDVPATISNESHTWAVRCRRSGVMFWVVPYIHYMAEVQMCRLAEYMCTFDNRCHYILALAKYWTLRNNVVLGQVQDKSKTGRSSYTLLEPYTLEWLVLFFLCHQKLIPTPRQIQQRQHDILNEKKEEVDIGFEADPEFAREWIAAAHKAGSPTLDNKSSEEFALSVLSLFQRFLQFCGDTLHEGHYILNTRDGELIDIDAFLTSNPANDSSSTVYWTTQMTPEELAAFRSIEATFSSAESKGEKISPYKISLKTWKLYMLHPFIFTRKFSISVDIQSLLPMMGRGGAQLKKYLNMRKSNGEHAAKVRFGTLENVMLVEK